MPATFAHFTRASPRSPTADFSRRSKASDRRSDSTLCARRFRASAPPPCLDPSIAPTVVRALHMSDCGALVCWEALRPNRSQRRSLFPFRPLSLGPPIGKTCRFTPWGDGLNIAPPSAAHDTWTARIGARACKKPYRIQWLHICVVISRCVYSTSLTMKPLHQSNRSGCVLVLFTQGLATQKTFENHWTGLPRRGILRL